MVIYHTHHKNHNNHSSDNGNNMANDIKPEYNYSDITEKIINCALKVHNTLRNGLQEGFYQRALTIEMELQNLKFKREVAMPVFYRNHRVGTRRIDFMVENVVLTETKAVLKLEQVDLMRSTKDLEVFHTEVGLLLNFGATQLQYHRLENQEML